MKSLITAVLAFAFACCFSYAYPHDNPDNWIGQERRKNADGAMCCGNNDCQSYTIGAS